MLKREWQSLFHNKFLVVVLIAIMTIPTIYTTIFLGSMWDPYGEVDKLPVAVVNNDKSVTYNDKELKIGEDLIKNLKEKDSLDFSFLDQEQAKDGLANGTYYMVITIPEDFSANASTVMDEKPKKMELHYETNPGTNYIASKMSDTALTKIRESVAEKVTKVYTETIFDSIDEVGDGMSDAADGSKKIKDGAKKLSKGNKTITKNLKKLSSSSLTFKDGANTLQVGLKTYTDGVSTVNNGAKQLSEGISTLASGTGTLSSGANKLKKGSSALKTGVSDYTNGVGTAYDGSKQLAANNKVLNDGVGTLSSGVGQLKNGSASLLTGLQTMSTTIGNSLNADKEKQLTQVTTGLDTLNNGIQTLNTTLQNANLNLNVDGLVTGLTTNLTNIKDSATNAGKKLKQDVPAAVGTAVTKDLQEAAPQAIAALTQSDEFRNMSSDDQQRALQLMTNLVGSMSTTVRTSLTNSLTTSLNSVGDDIKSIGTSTANIATTVQQSNITDTVDKATTMIGTLKTNVKTIADNSNILLPGSKKAITELKTGLGNVKTALDKTGTTAKDMGVLQAMQTIDGGLATVQTGIDSESGLKNGITSYTAGVSKLNTGLKTITDNSAALKSGATQLSTGIGTLTKSLPTLITGVDKLNTGAKTLATGTGKLTANNQTLLGGASKLANGAGQISDGAGKLSDGSVTLGDGLNTLLDGSNTLTTSLKDGADKVKDSKANDSSIKMMSNPVKAKKTEMSKVENNGHAMSAYMMSVALWVGCLAFCIMYPLTEYKGKLESGFKWWASKASVITVISVSMAIIMIYMLQGILGFEPKYFGKTIGLAILASMAFMSVMYLFNILLGKVGSFIMLIFMVLQLGGSAGTYPLELSGKFYHVINPFMPFTYTVNGFRKTIATGRSLTPDIMFLSGMLVVCTLLTFLVFHIRAKKINRDAQLQEV